MENIYLGIDVGTGGVRVGAFTRDGRMISKGQYPIKTWHPRTDFVEQSSEDIWQATGKAVQGCLFKGPVDPAAIKGIAFDATCSLVALGRSFEPITISPTGNNEQNVIVWMDHRATEETELINSRNHSVLQYVGGRISPEMEPPKLMWLKNNLKNTWKDGRKFIDLADYLVYRASGNDYRSLCTTVCKWTYLGHESDGGGYDPSFFKENDMEELFDNDRVPLESHPVGGRAGELTKEAAAELGLPAGIAIGVGIIDAHAGGIGSLGAALNSDDVDPLNHAIALIGGTSSCHMAVSEAPRFIDGVWGPYYGAMFSGMWLNEGGQSATGSLIDLIIQNNGSYNDLVKAAQSEKIDVYSCLNRIIENEIAQNGLKIFNNYHVLPYFHGNRSPRADSSARGMMSGLNLNQNTNELALWYGATVQAISYGTRHIIKAMDEQGYAIDTIYMSGGHLKNSFFIQQQADITGCTVITPEEPEAVLLGGAILAALAAGEYSSLNDGLKNMCRSGATVRPDQSTKPYHEMKYEIFLEMYGFQKKIHTKMNKITG
ncbi:MAG: FGGY-family carbohydrate kinase [Deltaproteobacteria bacterium]|nr:FGGY-family carbohydrate kinase [Deltaproteobacteria bacterium]